MRLAILGVLIAAALVAASVLDAEYGSESFLGLNSGAHAEQPACEVTASCVVAVQTSTSSTTQVNAVGQLEVTTTTTHIVRDNLVVRGGGITSGGNHFLNRHSFQYNTNNNNNTPTTQTVVPSVDRPSGDGSSNPIPYTHDVETTTTHTISIDQPLSN